MTCEVDLNPVMKMDRLDVKMLVPVCHNSTTKLRGAAISCVTYAHIKSIIIFIIPEVFYQSLDLRKHTVVLLHEMVNQYCS